ncbi:hypothetical protein [Paenibacillus sp. GP183]|uniref:hypothetical protein n=1 Tax=Paenibacillus sp. GP183 TaxID=1882751 RepID=UPI00209BAC30|nr:hypothetical protein [Paenibacillus sp. GP183]
MKKKWVVIGISFVTIVTGGMISAFQKSAYSDVLESVAPNTSAVILTKDIYVSPSGNNNNPGTVDAPLANIQTAIDAVLPGGTEGWCLSSNCENPKIRLRI